jgi:LCP family protein required for cell wall assembly
MADGPFGSSRSSPDDATVAKKRALANEQRLQALGAAVDQRSGVQRKPTRRGVRRGRNWLIALGVVVIVIVGVVGGGYVYANWRFGQIKKINVAGEVKPISGQPFNILSIGSDSRVGLTGAVAAQTGASTGAVSGQRSDVVKIIHVDPTAGTISLLSIPRDTMTTLLANQATYGKFNRINVNFGGGPSLLTQTITANFGIPIANTIVVSFAGLMNAADAVGGVRLNFPYPAKDPFSGLKITHAGCQTVTGFQALAVARSRHYYWYQNGVWNYDVTSDFGRIWRQNVFLRAVISKAKGLYSPFTINSFLSKLPQGITLDSNFSLHELIGLALKFHGLNTASIKTYTLPTVTASAPGVGSVLFVNQPLAQQMLVGIFGKQLLTPSNPPPNSALQTPLPPVIAPTTSTTSSAPPKSPTTSKSPTPTTTTTVLTVGDQYFDPTTC